MNVDRCFANLSDLFDILKDSRIIVAVNVEQIDVTLIKFLNERGKWSCFTGIEGSGYLHNEGANIAKLATLRIEIRKL